MSNLAHSKCFVAHRNGRPASAEELAPLAFAGFAHFTAMQVRAGRVRGIDLHLERLQNASVTMFGRSLPDDRIRSYIRAALEASPPHDLSLRITVSLPNGERTLATEIDPEVLIRTGPAASGLKTPLSVIAVEHERLIAAVKHVGEVAKTSFLRQAVESGFDDAVFFDRLGRISEASIWNVVFWDGDAVVWPEAEMLVGTTMGIVRRQLENLGIPQRVQPITRTQLPEFLGMALMNSWTPGLEVRQIDSVTFPEASHFVHQLHRAYESEPLTPP